MNVVYYALFSVNELRLEMNALREYIAKESVRMQDMVIAQREKGDRTALVYCNIVSKRYLQLLKHVII